jgi:L-seryl-tRNA(Ser) seleniumtransferase
MKTNPLGIDLVTFSGDKRIRDPQDSGLLLRRKHLIEAATADNNPISDTIGRGIRVSRGQSFEWSQLSIGI